MEPEPLWRPDPDNKPQMLAYTHPAAVLGFGGAAGGSKTDLIIGKACTQHLRSLVLRREQKQGESMIERSQEILGGCGARLNSVKGIWRGIPAPGHPRGRMIHFAGVKDAKDVYKYRGNPHDLLAIDEADAFLEAQIRFLAGWIRTTVEGQRTQLLLCFNPPATAEGRWLL